MTLDPSAPAALMRNDDPAPHGSVMKRKPTPHPSITFYPFDEGAALHRKGSLRLIVLNVTAATLWCMIDGTRDKSQLAREYGRRFGLEPDVAIRDVEIMLLDFAQQGLLSGSAMRNAAGAATIGDECCLNQITFCVAGCWFRLLCCHKELCAEWFQVATPLLGEPAPGEPVVEILVLPDIELPDHRLRLWCGQETEFTVSGLRPENVMPYLFHQVFERVCAGKRKRVLIHAAVLARDDRSVVFAAPTGAGKSTLCAALCESGWEYLSDELAIIDPQTMRVEPYAMPIGLKSASVGELADFLPGLGQKPVHLRNDGRRMRYLMPSRVIPGGSLPVAALIFPHLRPGEATGLKALSPLTALKKLAATGSSERPLTDADIKTFLALAQRPAYELVFGDLKSAAELLGQLPLAENQTKDASAET
jgi:hypothetical protein